MPAGDSGEKTERPTPRKLRKAREEGQVAKSQELNSAFTLLGSFLLLYFMIGGMINSLKVQMTALLSLNYNLNFNTADGFNLIMEQFYYIARLVGPIMLGAGILGGFINLIQVGPLFSAKAIKPKLSNISFISGVKKIFSAKTLMELAKSLLKAGVISWLAFTTVRQAWPEMLVLPERGIEAGLLFVAQLIWRIAVKVIILMIFIGVADYIFQRWQHNKNLMMTKQEVKEERKQMEGDPQVKQQRRQKQRQMSLNRMMTAMEDADVVITNPTHIAIAIKYDLEDMEAPVVLAKGEGYVAQRIREKAKELEIEIVENKPLARALNEATEIGQEIPVDLYQAVAEILAFIYRNNHS